jgi:lipoprotein-anchoring transpeptidase ErfK/SrfK
MWRTILLCGLLSAGVWGKVRVRVERQPPNPEAVNNPATTDVVRPGAPASAILRAQILLDRRHFSVGEIDGAWGSNLRKAISAFQFANGKKSTGVLGAEEWALLNADPAPALIPYTISGADVAGPFEPVPVEMMEKAKLDTLGYQSTLEALGEAFHASPKLLQKLNPQATFATAGEQIVVPNAVTDLPPKAARVFVDKSDSSVTAFDKDGKLVAFYPATIGSTHDPLPLGKWKIKGVGYNPVFHYNPKLFWDANSSDTKATIAPGPNNPVGVVWIDLSKSHYGIHGTPEPSTIGKTQSHGCIRLTNWDAEELAALVSPGMEAILQR